ncbi:hypothetical protein BDZ88DRAFT_482174 [Geranomyces variabilis]|nr:hypothetical protein BDZ88DRAFT_482174 [Geranomyces variabilis]KAJ3142417.1 hypothetical protein HDU90_004691 [Geranomyces variabilis]
MPAIIVLTALPREILDEILTHLPLRAVHTLGTANRVLRQYLAARLEPIVLTRFGQLAVWRTLCSGGRGSTSTLTSTSSVERAGGGNGKEEADQVVVAGWLRGAVEAVKRDVDAGRWGPLCESDSIEQRPPPPPPTLFQAFRPIWTGVLAEQTKTIFCLTLPSLSARDATRIFFLCWNDTAAGASSAWKKTVYASHVYMDAPVGNGWGIPPHTQRMLKTTRYRATRCAARVVLTLARALNACKVAGREDYDVDEVLDVLRSLCGGGAGGAGGAAVGVGGGGRRAVTAEEWVEEDTDEVPAMAEHIPMMTFTHPAHSLILDAAPFVPATLTYSLIRRTQAWCTSIQTGVPGILHRYAGWLTPAHVGFIRDLQPKWSGGEFCKTPYFDDWLWRLTEREDVIEGRFHVQTPDQSATFRLSCSDTGLPGAVDAATLPRSHISFTCLWACSTKDDKTDHHEPLVNLLDRASLQNVIARLGSPAVAGPDADNHAALFALLACAFPPGAPPGWAWDLCRLLVARHTDLADVL